MTGSQFVHLHGNFTCSNILLTNARVKCSSTTNAPQIPFSRFCLKAFWSSLLSINQKLISHYRYSFVHVISDLSSKPPNSYKGFFSLLFNVMSGVWVIEIMRIRHKSKLLNSSWGQTGEQKLNCNNLYACPSFHISGPVWSSIKEKNWQLWSSWFFLL